MIDKLQREAQICTSLLRRSGIVADLDEVHGELSLLYINALRAYQRYNNHEAKFSTYFNTAVNNWVIGYRRMMQREKKLFARTSTPDQATECCAEIAAIITEIKERLNEEDKTIFAQMLYEKCDNESLCQKTGMTYRQITRSKENIRRTAKEIMEVQL